MPWNGDMWWICTYVCWELDPSHGGWIFFTAIQTQVLNKFAIVLSVALDSKTRQFIKTSIVNVIKWDLRNLTRELYLKQIMALEESSVWVIEDEWEGVLFETEKRASIIYGCDLYWDFPLGLQLGMRTSLKFLEAQNHLDFFF